MPLKAHAWSVAPTMIHCVLRQEAPPAEPWEATLQDPVAGVVHLTGRLSRTARSKRLIVVIHGLGGSHASFYAVRAARAARQMGLDCLRLNLRGADRSGEDYYHAGLTEDLDAALASPSLRSYETLSILGYSLGGHMALRYATLAPDPRVKAVAAVCSPLDLDPCCTALAGQGISLAGVSFVPRGRPRGLSREPGPQTGRPARVGASNHELAPANGRMKAGVRQGLAGKR